MLRRTPELGFAHDLQIEGRLFAWVVLEQPGRLVGAVACHHHGLAGVKQKGGGDVLARERREGYRIGAKLFKQVVGHRRRRIEIAVFGVHDQRQLPGHQIPHLQQQLQAHGPQGLVEAEAWFVGADVGGGLLDHGLDPMARLAQERASPHAVAGRPALQHLRVGVEPSHQQRLALGYRIC